MKDNKRYYDHWLLLFPKGTVLNNVVISGHHSEIKMNNAGVREKDGTNIGNTRMIYWLIAKSGGARLSVMPSTTTDDDFED